MQGGGKRAYLNRENKMTSHFSQAVKSIIPVAMMAMAGFSQAAKAADSAPDDPAWHITVGPEFGAQGFKGNGAAGPVAAG